MPYEFCSILRLGTVLIACVAIGCGGAEKPVREIPPEVKTKVSSTIDAYESAKNIEKLGGVSKLNARLARDFKGALSKRTHARFSHDPALDVLAALHIYAYATQGAFPATSLSEWVLWKLGVCGNYVAGNAWAGSGQGIKAMLTSALKDMARDLELEKYHYSFGVARIEVGTTVAQSIVIVRKDVLIQDLKKRYEPGEEILLRGKIRVPFKEPELYMDLSETEVHDQPMEVTDDGKFAIKLNAPTEPGRHFLQIMTEDPEAEDEAEDQYWNHSLMMIPIYVGAKEPALPDEMIRKPPVNPPERKDWPGRILALYNAARQAKGLDPIVLNPTVQELAAERAEQFAGDDELPPDTKLWKKLARAGLVFGRNLKSQGYVEFVDELAWFHMLSPSHRASLFSEELEMAGIGIARKDRWRSVYVEYLMGDQLEQADERQLSPEQEKQHRQLLAAIMALREGGGVAGDSFEIGSEQIEVIRAMLAQNEEGLSESEISEGTALLEEITAKLAAGEQSFDDTVWLALVKLKLRLLGIEIDPE